MSDDGSGAGIRIPSVLISEKDGERIFDFFLSASSQDLISTIAVMEFDIRRPDNRVEYDIWYTSNGDTALDFFQDFRKIDASFGKSVLMTPRFVFWECIECDNAFMKENCLGGGRYCAEVKGNGISGKDVVLEDLREMCIYQQAYYGQGKREMFWEYIDRIHSECGSTLNEECSMNTHKRVKGLNWDQTNECVKQSFSTPDESLWQSETTTN